MESRQPGFGDQGKPYPSDESLGARNLFGDDPAPLSLNGHGVLAQRQGRPPALGGEGRGRSPQAEEQQWDRRSPCPSEDWVMTSTWDMQLDPSGLLETEPLREADEDLASEVNYPILTEEEREEIQQELAKLEEEISTLKQVLSSKEKLHSDLKQKLGITPLSELRNNFTRGWQDMQTSVAYKKTSETLSTAGQKTTAALSTLGTTISRKFGDMRSNSIGYSLRHSMSMPTMRNSPSFKTFEEKVENTVTNIKTKVGGTGSGGSFEEVLSSAAQASSQEMPTNNLTETSEQPC